MSLIITNGFIGFNDKLFYQRKGKFLCEDFKTGAAIFKKWGCVPDYSDYLLLIIYSDYSDYSCTIKDIFLDVIEKVLCVRKELVKEFQSEWGFEGVCQEPF